ncbi:MAG: hypothetical protein WCF85_00065 [Rhodospirillaceae bacterium]
MRQSVRSVLAAGLLLVLTGCVQPDLRGARVTVEPSYIFKLGVHQDDVMRMLGDPPENPHFDRLTQLVMMTYTYPFPAIQAETQFSNGTTRSEMVDHIVMFFDRNHLLVKMAAHTDRWYPSVTGMPVQRITVLPRVVHPDGRVTAPKPAPDVVPGPPPPPRFNSGPGAAHSRD